MRELQPFSKKWQGRRGDEEQKELGRSRSELGGQEWGRRRQCDSGCR